MSQLIYPNINEKYNDVQQPLFQMDPHKASGLDGYSALFYQKSWHVIGADLTKFVCQCFSSGSIPSLVNETLIVLIPKISNPTKLAHYRPISLCNVSYKLVTKIIVNRIKDFMPSVIAPTHSSFVPRRQITILLLSRRFCIL